MVLECLQAMLALLKRIVDVVCRTVESMQGQRRGIVLAAKLQGKKERKPRVLDEVSGFGEVEGSLG